MQERYSFVAARAVQFSIQIKLIFKNLPLPHPTQKNNVNVTGQHLDLFLPFILTRDCKQSVDFVIPVDFAKEQNILIDIGQERTKSHNWIPDVAPNCSSEGHSFVQTRH